MIDNKLNIKKCAEKEKDSENSSVLFYKNQILEKVNEFDPVTCTAILTIIDCENLGYFNKSEKYLAKASCELYSECIQDRIIQSKNINKFGYAGIGSKKTPDHVLNLMRKIAHRLSELNYKLHSGGAVGADLAFENGCSVNKDIFLPKPKYNMLSNRIQAFFPSDESLKIAEIIHPIGNQLSGYVKLLMARNSHQVLGRDLRSPVKFVVCWTPDGCERAVDRSRATGGTGQAITIADLWGIPVFNLANGRRALDRIGEIVNM